MNDLTTRSNQHINLCFDQVDALFSKSTAITYKSVWRKLESYCDANGLHWYELNSNTYIAYLNDLAQELSPVTIAKHHSILISLFSLMDAKLQINVMLVRRWLTKLKKEKQTIQKQANGIQHEDLVNILSAIGGDSHREIQQRLLLNLMYDSLLRRSEVSNIRVEHVEENPDGSGILTIPSTKTSADVTYALLSKTTMQCLEQWLLVIGTEGYLFRGIDRHDNVSQNKLSDRSIQRQIQYAAEAAGYDKNFFSGHSLRVGAAIDMVEAGIGLSKIMHAGRWKSAEMVARYTRKLEATKNGAADLASKLGR